jgi:predicted aldo/keto reductase-like oxidoreductase
MRYKHLGNTDINASVVSFGGIPIQRVGSKQAVEILDSCKQNGINFIDTARMYGDSEEKIGTYFQAHGRKDWYVATKSTSRDYESMAADVRISLAKMACGYIDLYQLHNVAIKEDMERVMEPDGALAALEDARRQGIVRHIGITGHKPEILDPAVSSGRFATLQVPFNALEQQALPLIKRARQQQNMGIIAMKPLAGGALTTVLPALAYVINSEYVDIAIPGMESVEQVVQNCGAVDRNVDSKQLQELEELIAGLGNQFCRRCEYCQPCPTGLKIPAMFLFEGYYSRYNLKDWAKERYATLAIKASDCNQCGICESRCPYDLPIRKMLAQTAATLEKRTD